MLSQKKYKKSEKGRITQKRYNNSETKRIANRRWWENNPEKARSNHLKTAYGVSIEEYNKLLKKQNNKCAICGIDVAYLNENMSVDHDHNTNKIRALLCRKCNAGLGFFNDDISKLQKAIDYLFSFFD